MSDDKIVLRPKPARAILFGIGSMVFTVGGILMMDEESLMGSLTTSFFGLGVIVFLVQLIPGSTELVLTKEGFIVTSLFRSNLTKWSDVKKFKIGYLGKNKAVLFDYVDGHNKYNVGKSISKVFSNSHGALPSNYGLSVTELLNLMNDWKNKCLA